MEGDELGSELVRIDNGYLVDEDTYVVHSDDVLDEENNSDSGGKNMPLREQDRFLPIANIAKIMKRAIPENGKIAKDARECVQECISEFISFVTSEASDRCQIEKRKTINGEDILFALNALGFDSYVEPMKLYLKKYREIILSPLAAHLPRTSLVDSQPKGEIWEEDFETEDQDVPQRQETKVSINKLNKTILIYNEDGTACVPADNDSETHSDSAVLYSYPKVMEAFTIT